jgi:hypothetical protein
MHQILYRGGSKLFDPQREIHLSQKRLSLLCGQTRKKMHASHKQARVHDATVIDRNIIDVPYNYKKGGDPA